MNRPNTAESRPRSKNCSTASSKSWKNRTTTRCEANRFQRDTLIADFFALPWLISGLLILPNCVCRHRARKELILQG